MTAYEEFLCIQLVEQEVKKVEQELAIYKKALENLAYDTAYEPMGNLEKRIAFKKERAQETIARYLKKAREEND